MMQTQLIINQLRKLNLEQYIFEELEDQTSPTWEYIQAFTLHYFLTHLPSTKKTEFVRAVATDNLAVLSDFTDSLDPKFLEEYTQNLAQSLQKQVLKVAGVTHEP